MLRVLDSRRHVASTPHSLCQHWSVTHFGSFSQDSTLVLALRMWSTVVLSLGLTASHYYVYTYAHTYSHIDVTQHSQSQATYIGVFCFSQRFSLLVVSLSVSNTPSFFHFFSPYVDSTTY
jgi:hypothetical protein